MHNHGVLGNTPPNGGFGRFQALHGDNNLAVWLQDAGYYTALIGKYLNGYSNNPPVPPGWSEWHAAAPDTQEVYDYTLNENGTLVHYGQNPADFKQDVLTRKAVGFVNRRAPKAQPFFLWLTYTAPHGGGPNPNPNPPFNCGGTAKPAPRHAHAFDSEPLPKPPNFNEADVSDKPAEIRNLPRLSAESDRGHPAQVPLRAGVAPLGRRGRQEDRRCAEGEGRARQHPARLHLRQRLLPRRAPDPRAARGTSTRSRSGCRSRCGARASRGG